LNVERIFGREEEWGEGRDFVFFCICLAEVQPVPIFSGRQLRELKIKFFLLVGNMLLILYLLFGIALPIFIGTGAK